MPPPVAWLLVGVAAGAAAGWLARAVLLARRDLWRRARMAAREAQSLRERDRASEAAAALEAAKARADEARALAEARLAEAAGLSPQAARTRILEDLDRDLAQERARRVARADEAARRDAEARAREVVCTAIQRVAVAHAGERTVTAVPLPDESMKGRVIGREGRNAQAFERATGCDVLVDETPGVVTISGFDPVRREVARRAMAALVADGRIHPGRIEEAVAAARREVDAQAVEDGRAALAECDAGDAHERVAELLGRLRYRTSYGQNVLRHSVEVAHLCGLMAAELGLDARVARRAGLLHDVGKAVSHEAAGPHAVAGGEVARACGEAPVVVNAIASHHEDVPQESAYAVLAQVADAVSASRPGARTDPAEQHVQRLRDLERVAAGFPGVREAYAVQAGREVRVIADASKVTDEGAVALAREIARAVEAQLTYPGEVRVTVLRETQGVAYAR